MNKYFKKWCVIGMATMMAAGGVLLASASVKASASATKSYTITLYKGNDQADGFVTSEVTIKNKTAYSIIKELKAIGAVAKNVKANSLEFEGKELVLDLSKEFAVDVASSGTAGEYIKVGSVVNTFIDAYNTKTLTITVEGKSWESGHVVYDGPLSKYGSSNNEDLENDNEYAINLYVGNENADGFNVVSTSVKYKTAFSIIQALKAEGAVAKNVKAISLKYVGKNLVLDLSKEFANDVSSSGTAGEYIKVGSVVNTFIDAFDVETLTITVEGKSWESGHVTYDGPLSKFN